MEQQGNQSKQIESKRDPKAKSLCSKIDDHKSSHGKIRTESREPPTPPEKRDFS